jgi:O-succinylbenzoic acid--CoA ligase
MRGLRVLDLAESVCITRNPKPETRNPVIDTGARATIVFTSGSAGEPKAAVHSYGNHYFSAAASNRNLPVARGDGWLLSLSLHHVAGIEILFRCVLGGGAVVIPCQEKPSRGTGLCSGFDYDYEHEHEARGPAALLLQDIGREEVTHVSIVPTQLYRLLRTSCGRENLKRLKAILLGGGPIPESLIREAAALELPIFTTYGLTETASQVATTRPGDALDRLLTAGRPLISGTVSVASDGEILVRGPTLFLGYLEGGRVGRPLTSDGWFRTGDLGRMDDEGYLSVVGRKDNRFVCGGENVQPEEVERYLCRLTGLRAAVVVPVPDAQFGHIPVAFVAMKEGGKVNEQELAGSLTEELARSKIPRRFLAWPRDLEPGDAKLNRNGLMVLARTLTAESRGLQGR